jgi:small-conductance mechanosensitive channel
MMMSEGDEVTGFGIRFAGRRVTACDAALSFLLLVVFAMAEPAMAQVAPPGGNAVPAAIETDTGRVSDADIAERLQGIFGEIDGLAAVRVSVREGVVVLEGRVRAADDIARASALAERLVGVVTVENRIGRDLTVDENLTPALVDLRDDAGSVAAALPLVGLALAIGLAIAVAGYLLAGFDRLWRWVTPNNFLAELAASSLRVLFILLGLFVVLDILDATAALGAILGGAGVIGLAIGFALRDTVDNYISSIMLSLRQPFRPYDHVVIGNHEGRVVRLTSRATILMTLEGNHLRIPNATVFKAIILNYSRNPERRFEFDLGIDAADDAIEGMAVAVAALAELPFVLAEPPPSAHIRNVGDSNIVLTVLGWVNQSGTDFMKARSVAIWAAKRHLEQQGFALPEPIYRLRIDDPASAVGSTVRTPHAPAGTAVRDRAPAPPAAQTEADDDAIAAADVSRETYIDRKVAEERTSLDDGDLLSPEQPVE